MKILGIETSCDETSCAVIEGKPASTRSNRGEGKKIKILSNIISSQINLHKKYGGVVPEIAARAHIENIIPALKASLGEAKLGLKNIDAIAATCGPGLLVSLLIGVNTAKSLALALNKPIIPINHIEGHIYANFINSTPKFPLLCLVVSGGHTSLILMKNHELYKILGQTLDDAAGEAFDKVGNLLELPYPGGPWISKAAHKGNPQKYNFPRAWLGESLNFSFSGLKTAVLYKTKKIGKLTPKIKADLAASFQEAVVEVLVKKTIKAAKDNKVRSICLAGGVAANDLLRNRLKENTKDIKKEFYVPDKILCTDNAAMIACAGYFHALRKDFTPWHKINVDLNLPL